MRLQRHHVSSRDQSFANIDDVSANMSKSVNIKRRTFFSAITIEKQERILLFSFSRDKTRYVTEIIHIFISYFFHIYNCIQPIIENVYIEKKSEITFQDFLVNAVT